MVSLMLGGDCTIEVDVVAGRPPSKGRLDLIYFDVHPDLNVSDGEVHCTGHSTGWACRTFLRRSGPRRR